MAPQANHSGARPRKLYWEVVHKEVAKRYWDICPLILRLSRIGSRQKSHTTARFRWAVAPTLREVTNYVREEFNRAEKLANDKRAGTVGFALTILQRRLASSPEAIYQSLRRRSERLQKRLRELELLQRGATVEAIAAATPALDSDVIRLNNHIGGVPTGFFVPASESDT